MANFNKIILVGNLTRDPQLSYLPSQTPVCEFGLAVNRTWTKDGEKREQTCFIDCRCSGKSAETFNQYMSKGQPILVEGRLDFDTWEGQDGTKRSKHRVFVQNFQFLGRPPGAGGASQRQAAAPEQARPEPPREDDVPPEPPGDDIPF